MEQLKALTKQNKGQMLIEILLAMALTALILPSVMLGLMSSKQGKAQQAQRMQAVALMKEGVEVIKNIKDQDWLNIRNATESANLHPVSTGTNWSLVTGSETIDRLTRSIVITPVQRNGSGVIVDSGGTNDPLTKKIVVTVSWGTPIASTVDTTFYITRFRGNDEHTDTTETEFDVNTIKNSVHVTNSNGGEVTLGGGGAGGDWCSPNLIQTTYDLPKSGVANAISAIEGTIFAATGENSAGVSFANVGITTPTPPVTPSPFPRATFDGYKTNDIFGDSNYGYLATDNNAKEVVIIDLNNYSDGPTNSKYAEKGIFNAPGNNNGTAVFASGSYGYMTTSNNKFYIFKLSDFSKVNSDAGETLSGTGMKIFVRGNYAFIATNSTSNQLQIFDISTPSTPQLIGQRTVDGLGGKGLYVNTSGTRVYLVTANSATKNEFFIINTENKSSPTLVSGGVYDTNGMDPKGVTVVTNRAIIVGSGGTNQYQVIKIDNENSPVSCGGQAVATGVNGVSSVLQSNGYAYSYIITGDASSELKIIEGGDGGLFSWSGDFTSEAFDAGTYGVFNYFLPTFIEPPGTKIKFQVAVAETATDCASASYTFIGPDKTSSTYYNDGGYPAEGPIPLLNDGYKNPGRCMKYKAYLSTTDYTAAPILESVVVNYTQ